MPLIDYLVIIVFTLLVVVAGLSFSKRESDIKSYFAASGAVPWSINGLSLYMSFFSAGTFVVWGSIAYELGWVAITIQMAMCIGGFVVAYFIAPKWRKTNVLSAAEFIKRRLGDKVQKFYTYIILLLSLAYTGAFLYPVAKIINICTGWSINTCVIGLGLLILLYTFVGGLWAVIVTDVLQFVILMAAIFLVVVLSLNEVGGIQGFLTSLPADAWKITTEKYSWWFILAFAIYNIIFIGGNWAYVQRYTSVKSSNDAKKVGLTFGWLYLISPFIWMLPPMIYKIINPNLLGIESEGAYMLIFKQVLPVGMLGLMLGGMVFATASSVNTTLNLAASIITNDLFLVFKPTASLKQIMNVAKLSTVLFGIGTIIIALLVPSIGGIVNVVFSIGAVTGCSLYGPLIWALFSKRHSGKTILLITIISLIVNISFKFFDTLSCSDEMLLGTISPFIFLVIYELYAKFKGINESEDYRIYNNEIKPDLSASVDVARSFFGMKILANTLLTVGVSIIGLGFLSSSSNALIVSIGAIIFCIGLHLYPLVTLKKLNSDQG